MASDWARRVDVGRTITIQKRRPRVDFETGVGATAPNQRPVFDTTPVTRRR